MIDDCLNAVLLIGWLIANAGVEEFLTLPRIGEDESNSLDPLVDEPLDIRLFALHDSDIVDPVLHRRKCEQKPTYDEHEKRWVWRRSKSHQLEERGRSVLQQGA